MSSRQVFWLTLVSMVAAMLSGVALLVFTAHVETGVALIAFAIGGGLLAKAQQSRACKKPKPSQPKPKSRWPGNATVLAWCLMVTLLWLPACVGPDRADVAVDRLYWQAWHQRYLPVLLGDAPPLDEAQKADARRYDRAWELELEAREARAR